MNTKYNLRFLVFFSGVLIAAWAYAQMGLRNDGVVFPDGSVQTTAAAALGTITEYRIVGFTTATTDGSVVTTDSEGEFVFGITALNRLCAAQFGTGTRAAFSNEQLAPSIPPSTAAENAWIQPKRAHVVHDPTAASGSDWLAYDSHSGTSGSADASAISALQLFACQGYTTNSSSLTGLVRLRNARIVNRVCDFTYPVACSAPVVITAP